MGSPAVTAPVGRGHGSRRVVAVLGLALLSAALLAVRAVDEALDDSVRMPYRVTETVMASAAVLCALGAAAALRWSEKWAAWLLGAALVLEVLLGYFEAPWPLVVVPPLLVALALVLLPVLRRESEPGVDYSTGHTVASTLSLALMVPIAFFYLLVPMVAPEELFPWAILIYSVLVGATVWLAARRSWWVVAGPVLALVIVFGGLSLGEHLYGWTA